MTYKRILILYISAVVLCSHCLTTEGENLVEERQRELLNLDELEGAAHAYLDDFELGGDLDEGLGSLMDTGISELDGVLKKAMKSGLLILSVVLLQGIASGLIEPGGGHVMSVVPMTGALAITAVAVSDVSSLLRLGESTIGHMTDFANILFPAVTALSAATGAITGGAVRQMTAMLFADILMNLIHKLLIPMVWAFLAVSVSYAAFGNEGLKRVGAFLKWAVTILLTVLLMAFVGYLTLSGVVAGHTDAAAIKAAKFTLSSTIPVVGGILSDAAETVLVGTGILRGSVGVLGTLTILAICIVPFLQLGVHYLVYKLTAALSATVSDGRTAGLIDSIGAAFGLILGMTGAGTLMLLISLISALTVTSL